MHRIKLESALHAENVFLTLTYADEYLPRTQSGLATLSPEHLKLFLDRVRTRLRRLEDRKLRRRIRFFAVGEYGDISFRPHYHAVLFNYPHCLRGRTRTLPKFKRCCFWCDLITDEWYTSDDKGGKATLGRIESVPLSDALMTYIGGYVTKKMTRRDDPRLEGRYPEFSRQSRNPGVGFDALHDVADVLMKYYDVKGELGDVPVALGSGGVDLPLGRYMRGKLRKMVGMDEKAPQVTVEKSQEEMRALRDIAIANSYKPGGEVSQKKLIQEKYRGRVASVEARYRIFKQRRSI